MENSGTIANARIWKALYAAGKNDLIYPSEIFVRVFSRVTAGVQGPLRILDYGFGTGANLIHMVKRGHILHGVEISAHALEIAQNRLNEQALQASLALTSEGEPIKFEDGLFDIVVSWLVIYYNDYGGMLALVRELERVTRRGGTVVIAIIAPGDISHRLSKSVGNRVYISEVPEQVGCTLVILEREDLPEFFGNEDLEIGEFSFNYRDTPSHHWIVTYKVA
jgi:SAM-dependent methyltransferase